MCHDQAVLRRLLDGQQHIIAPGDSGGDQKDERHQQPGKRSLHGDTLIVSSGSVRSAPQFDFRHRPVGRERVRHQGVLEAVRSELAGKAGWLGPRIVEAANASFWLTARPP